MVKTKDDVYLEPLARRFDALCALVDGWDSYSAPAPAADAIARGRGLVDALVHHGYAIAHVGPSVSGGVGITVERGATEYAIEFRNSGKAVVTVIAADGALSVHELKNAQTAHADILSILGGDPG